MTQGTQALPEDVELERMVAQMVQYMLVAEQRKLPVKKSELVKALQLRGSTSKTFKTVVAEAGQLLTNLFGYRLHELDERAGSFVLVNTVRLGRRDAACERQQRRDTILFLVLAAVHLAGGHLPEDDVWNLLDGLGMATDENKKMVLDLVRQLYLSQETQVPVTDPPKLVLSWGQRARLEFSAMDILEFAAEIYGCPVDTFGKLYTEAQQENRIDGDQEL